MVLALVVSSATAGARGPRPAATLAELVGARLVVAVDGPTASPASSTACAGAASAA